MECLDLTKFFEDPNPALFKSETGYAISFFLAIHEGALRRTLTKLIWDYGGRVETSYDSLLPRTVLLVDCHSYRPNYFDRLEFGTYYIVDCIMKNSLLPMNPYAYARKVIEPPKYFYDVVYYRTRVFKCIDKMDPNENTFTLLVSTPTNIKTLDELADKPTQKTASNCSMCKCTCDNASSVYLSTGSTCSQPASSRSSKRELQQSRLNQKKVFREPDSSVSLKNYRFDSDSDSSRSPSPTERLIRSYI